MEKAYQKVHIILQQITVGNQFNYLPDTDTLVNYGHGVYIIYENGIWATIKPQEEIISVGGKFDVKIKDGKIYHKNDDITTFVKDLVNSVNTADKAYGNDYRAKIKDVTFEYTGCQKVETKLSDWEKVLDTYNKFQNG